MRKQVLLLPLLALGLSGGAFAQDAAFVKAAYEACVLHVSQHIQPNDGEALSFKPLEDVVMADEYEVLIAFSSGAIGGADSEEPNPLTLMTKPAASCVATPGTPTFNRVVVNGEVVGENAAFALDQGMAEHHGHH